MSRCRRCKAPEASRCAEAGSNVQKVVPYLDLCPSLDLALGTGPASELAVLPVHHHDTVDQRGNALLELLMGRVLADIVIAVLGAGKLNHLCPAHTQVSSGHVTRKQHRGGTYKTMGCTVLRHAVSQHLVYLDSSQPGRGWLPTGTDLESLGGVVLATRERLDVGLERGRVDTGGPQRHHPVTCLVPRITLVECRNTRTARPPHIHFGWLVGLHPF